MLRTARAISPIVCSLLLGPALGMAAGVAALVMAGCADENDPETWVKKLDDAAQRPAAIKRLVQFFEDSMTRANKDRNDPLVKSVLDKVVEPLTKTYTDATLDDRTRVELIKFLADTRDPRAKPALSKACSAFAAGSGASEDDVRWAAPAIGALKLEDTAQALGAAFVKLEAGTQKGSQAYKNVHDAMLALKSPSWKGMLLERINRPMDKPPGAGDSAKVTAYQNELFWQQTAAELLGELRDPSAVAPLLKAVMSKPDIGRTASIAIVKIGKDAVKPMVDALTGQDKAVVEYAKAQSGGNAEDAKAYVRVAAVVLGGGLGSPAALGPMVRTLETADSDLNRAIVARELTNIPATGESQKAFQVAFDKIPPALLLPPEQMSARSSLLEASSKFYDPQMVPWVIKQIREAKGNETEKGVVQTSGLVSAIKLMNKGQLAEVKVVVDKEGTQIEKDAYKLAAEVVNGCDVKVACYLSKIQEPSVQDEKHQFAGIKAAYMLGIAGNAGTALEAVQQLPKVNNAAIRFATGLAIDHLASKDGAPVADAITKMVQENPKPGDEPLKQVAYRLRAR